MSDRRRNRVVVPAAAALVLAVAVVAYLVISNNASNSGGDGGHRTAALSGSAVVRYRNLIETDTESGTLGYASSQTVYNRLSGTITWLPAVGEVIQPGQPLFRIDNEPVWLLSGTTPAYRELDSSDSDGPDIEELNANLVKLGMNPDGIVVDDEWQAATTAGIDELQEDYGETETGSLALGDVVFLPGPQLVGTLDGTVGSTGGGSAAASLEDPVSQDEFVSLDTATTTTGTSTTDTAGSDTTTTGATGTPTTSGSSTATKHHKKLTAAQRLKKLEKELKAEQKALKAQSKAAKKSGSPKSGSGSPKSSGGSPKSSSGSPGGTSGNGDNGNSGGGSPVAILQTTSTQLVATVDLSASSQSEARLGSHVSVEMPDGAFVGGTVSDVSSIAQSSSNGNNGDSGNGTGDSGSGSATVPVTITLNRRVKGAGLDQAAVSVNFTKQSARHVLSVPVTALIARSGSTFAVQSATAPYRLIPVTTGLFAAGDVQISGPGIVPGLRVTDSQG